MRIERCTWRPWTRCRPKRSATLLACTPGRRRAPTHRSCIFVWRRRRMQDDRQRSAAKPAPRATAPPMTPAEATTQSIFVDSMDRMRHSVTHTDVLRVSQDVHQPFQFDHALEHEEVVDEEKAASATHRAQVPGLSLPFTSTCAVPRLATCNSAHRSSVAVTDRPLGATTDRTRAPRRCENGSSRCGGRAAVVPSECQHTGSSSSSVHPPHAPCADG